MLAIRFGNPFSTGAVKEKPTKFETNVELPNWQTLREGNCVKLIRELVYEDIVLGLGEQLGGINKRGRKYITYNHDCPEHTPDLKSLYGSHPFIIIRGKSGLFIDYPGEIEFDVGFSNSTQLIITIKSENFDLYFWDEPVWQEIVTSYLELTGGIYVPPRWAFGYQQSRWSYPDAPSVQETADKFRQYGIPCDALYLDIDYMDNYKVFTINEQRFPEFGNFAQGLRQQGFHLVPIIDPGVKVEEGYDVYEEGREKGYFCKDKAGEIFEAAVWPGLTALPDFSSQEVRNWWGNLYDRLINLGIEGFWNDMNEPAIFYTSSQQDKVYRKLKSAAENSELDQVNLISLQHEIKSFHNSREDYQSFYQSPEKDKMVCHDEIHNLYGLQMTQSLAEQLQEKYPEQRFLLFSRSSYSGMQRYGGIWYGDNKSWWNHLELNIKLLINVNLVGFFYSGADIGGFGSDAESELMLRWLQLGVFSPLLRNHSAIYTRRQELWEFGKETMVISRNIIRLRYALLPGLYSSFLEYAGMNVPLIRPLMWNYSDKRSESIEDQFLYGRNLLLAPVYKSNARGRYVYLPEHRWLLWQARCWEEREMTVCQSGEYYFDCELERQLIFVGENQLMALQEPEDYVDQRRPDTLVITGLVTDSAEIKLMQDAGRYPAFSGMSVLKVKVEYTDGRYNLAIDTIKRENLQWKHLIFELYDVEGRLQTIHKKI